MNKERLYYLFNQYGRKACSREEFEEFIAAAADPNNRQWLEEMADATIDKLSHVAQHPDFDWEHIYLQVMNEKESKPLLPIMSSNKWRWAVAASIILLLGFSGYFLLFNKPANQIEIAKTIIPNDVKAPVKNRATIMLANGQRVYLDSVANGSLATQGAVNIIKLANGRIVYEGSATTQHIEYNTLYNPKGSEAINIALADGSKLWLNAGSSATFPVAFIGDERKVEITGEAYFEIAENAAMPFKLKKGNMEVIVLGTKFNVNAYDDEEDIKVTLLEGAVKVRTLFQALSNKDVILKPGQQAQVSSTIKLINSPDLAQVMAWKNGLFNFDNADLQTVLRQLGRWYDVDIIYEAPVSKREFGGKMQRNLNLSEVLKLLEKNNIHFRIEEKKLVVMQ